MGHYGWNANNANSTNIYSAVFLLNTGIGRKSKGKICLSWTKESHILITRSYTFFYTKEIIRYHITIDEKNDCMWWTTSTIFISYICSCLLQERFWETLQPYIIWKELWPLWYSTVFLEINYPYIKLTLLTLDAKKIVSIFISWRC